MLAARLYMGNLILEKHKARKEYTCHECKGAIWPGQEYYSVFHGGSGLRDIKFPDRIHEACAKPFLAKQKEK